MTSGARARLCVGKHKVERADPLAVEAEVLAVGLRHHHLEAEVDKQARRKGVLVQVAWGGGAEGVGGGWGWVCAGSVLLQVAWVRLWRASFSTSGEKGRREVMEWCALQELRANPKP